MGPSLILFHELQWTRRGYSGTRIISSRGFSRPSSRYLLRSLIPNFTFTFSIVRLNVSFSAGYRRTVTPHTRG